jgi:hypothetical protein
MAAIVDAHGPGDAARSDGLAEAAARIAPPAATRAIDAAFVGSAMCAARAARAACGGSRITSGALLRARPLLFRCARP